MRLMQDSGLLAAFTIVLTLGTTSARAQYTSGFEGLATAPSATVPYAPDLWDATAPAGTPGQDNYYSPPGTTSVTFQARAYSGGIPGPNNPHGIPDNPTGGLQFIDGNGPGSPTFARAQRDMFYCGVGMVTFATDICVKYVGLLPTAQNVGSFSVQPFPGSQSFIALARWVDVNTALNWNADYVWFNAAGTQLTESVADPAFQNLLVDNWYRWETDVDMATNQIVEVRIINVTAATAPVVHNPIARYMLGGTLGAPTPTGFRFFSGGGVAGNVIAWDNAAIVPEGGSLTTAPNFVSNNQGSTGGAVYFQLDVVNPNGVSIHGISLNSPQAIGTYLSSTVSVHNTLTDPFALTSANVTAANWTTLCGLTGTAAGIDVPSPMSVVSPTNSLDLPFGTYLLAIANCPGWAHRYTNGGPALQTVTDGNLTYFGGRATNVSFSGTPFGTATTARVTNATFDYCVPSLPITAPTAGVAVCPTGSVSGAGCGGQAAQVYEVFSTTNVFDLANNDLLFANGGGNSTIQVSAPGTPIVPPIAPAFALGDDTNTALLPIGFTCDVGSLQFDSISIASNGYVWLGATGRADFSDSEAEMNNEGARLAMHWDDLNPSIVGSGGVHLDLSTNLAIVTFNNVFYFGSAGPGITVQLEITPNSMLLRHDPTSPFTTDCVVGFSNGVRPAAFPGSTDLNSGATTTVAGGPHLSLALTGLPQPGGSMDMVLSGNPSVGAVLADLGQLLAAPVPLPTPLFAAGCNQYIVNTNLSLGITTSNVAAFSIPVPAGPAFVGLPFTAQGASLGGASGLMASNAAAARVSNL